MAKAVKLSEAVVAKAKIRASATCRSMAGQIEYWVKIGQTAEDNPDLTYQMIRDILISREEAKAGKVEPYEFD